MKFFLSILILFIGFTLFSEQYSLDQLIEIGLENSYDLNNANLDLKDSEAMFRSSLYSILPSLSVSASRSETNKVWNPPSAAVSISESISLDEPRYFSIRQSILNKKNSKLSFKEKRKQYVYNIFSLYIDILEAQKYLKIQKENLQLQDKIKEQTEIQYNNGKKSLLELKQSKLNLIESRISVQRAMNSLSNFRKNIFSMLNADDEGFEFSDIQIDIESKLAEYSQNSNIKINLHNLTSKKLSKVQSLFNLFPTVSATYSHEYNKYDAIFDFDNYSHSRTFSLNLNYNVFGIFDNMENYIISKHNVRRQLWLNEEYEKSYKKELETKYEDYKTTQETFVLYKEKLQLAKESMEMAQEQFDLGIINIMDLDQVRIEYLNSQKSYNSNYYSLIKLKEEINLLVSEKILGKW